MPVAARIAIMGLLCGCAGLPTGSAVAPPFTGLVDTADGRLWVRCAGDGPDVVLLHGLGDSAVTWHKLEDTLRAHGYRTTVIDALGAGRSDKPGGPYGLPAHVARLHAVLDALGIGRAVLVANSLGGSVALRFAELHGDRVRALALISPATYAEGGWTGDWLWRIPDLAALLERLPPGAVARLALAMNFGDPWRVPPDDVALYAAEAQRPGTFAAFVRQQQQLLPTADEIAAWTAGYARIDVPVLVLWGTRDRILAPALGERLCRELPRAVLVPLPGVGHAAQLEAPQLVLAELLPFLTRVAPR